MDEYNRGMDPELKKYFKKITVSFSWGAIWLLSVATLGIFFQLAFIKENIRWYNILFYIVFAVSLFLLLRYYLKSWAKK